MTRNIGMESRREIDWKQMDKNNKGVTVNTQGTRLGRIQMGRQCLDRGRRGCPAAREGQDGTRQTGGLPLRDTKPSQTRANGAKGV